MVFIAILIGCIFGALIGMNAPMISYTYSSYLAIAIIAALDSVLGCIAAVLYGKFDMKVFVTGFFGNAILSILTLIGILILLIYGYEEYSYYGLPLLILYSFIARLIYLSESIKELKWNYIY